MRCWVGITLSASVALANPLADIEARSALPPAVCKVVNSVITNLHLASSATAFCSSYLSISTKVSTTTASITQVATSLVTDTTGTTTLVAPVSTVTSVGATFTPTDTTSLATSTYTDTIATSVVTASITVTNCIYSSNSPGKRGAALKSVAKPACFSAYVGPVLSSACSCLNIPTPIDTKTATTSIASTRLSSVLVADSTTVTPLTTTLVTPTATVDATTTFDYVSTSDATYTTTTTVTVAPTFYLQSNGNYAIETVEIAGEIVGGQVTFTSSSETGAILYTMDPSTCDLEVASGTYAGQLLVDDTIDGDPDWPYQVYASGTTVGVNPLVCSIKADTSLSCTDGQGNSGYYILENYFFIGYPGLTGESSVYAVLAI